MDYDFAGFNLIIERYRIASALESDSGEVDGDIALLADDLAILLVIARVTAVVTCVKTDTVRSTIFLDDDETHHRAVFRLILEAMQMTIVDLTEFDGGHAVAQRIILRRRQRNNLLRLRHTIRERERDANHRNKAPCAGRLRTATEWPRWHLPA